MARVLVTGGSGFIGTNLCKFLHDSGHEVISFDAHHLGAQAWECVTGDIRDELNFQGVDWVVHLAAQISVQRSIENPDETLSVNVDGTSSVISASEYAGVKRIIFASSAAVYGDCEEIPVKEESPLMPQSPYAVSKIVGEELIKRSKIPSCSLRFFNVYGEGQSMEGGYAAVIPAFKRAISENRHCSVFGDGSQVRDFIHVSDLVRIISTTLEVENLPPEMNVGSGEGTSILQLLEILSKANPSMLDPIFLPSREGDIHTSISDIARLKDYVDVSSIRSIEEGLA
tara:strand:+ start:1150 stop:2004 length:855 start_codon:yes stop_codon:yes gene_type:complete